MTPRPVDRCLLYHGKVGERCAGRGEGGRNPHCTPEKKKKELVSCFVQNIENKRLLHVVLAYCSCPPCVLASPIYIELYIDRYIFAPPKIK